MTFWHYFKYFNNVLLSAFSCWFIRLLALLVKKLQIFVKKILIEKYNFN
ncbi:hypothetical protein [Spiroplasma poulsonii]|nr:hypothetical protein [Spiroplasma poulsonii]